MAVSRALSLKRVVQSVRSALDLIATIMVVLASTMVINLALQARPALEYERTADQPPPETPYPLDGAMLQGNADAKVAFVEYADFECPFCGQFARETWPEIRREYVEPGKVLVAFRHLPLPGHSFARHAAISADCAGEQGEFWQMHDSLFSNQTPFTGETGHLLASRLGLDMPAFDKCVGQVASDSLSRDHGFATTFSIVATPTFLVGRVRTDNTVKITHVLVGAQPLARFRTVLNELLEDRGRWSLGWLRMRR